MADDARISGLIKQHLESYDKDQGMKKQQRSKLKNEQLETQRMEQQKMEMLQKIQIADLIDGSEYVWTPQALESKQMIYQIGEQISYYFAKGNSIVNVAKSKFLHRNVIKYQFNNANPKVGIDVGRLVCINSPLANLQVVSLTFDSISAIDVQGERSRPQFNAIMQRFKDVGACKDLIAQGFSDQMRFKLPVLSVTTNGVPFYSGFAGAQAYDNAVAGNALAMNFIHPQAGNPLNMYVSTDKTTQSLNQPMYYGNDLARNYVQFDVVEGVNVYNNNQAINDSGVDSSLQAYYYQGLEQYAWRSRYYSVSPVITLPKDGGNPPAPIVGQSCNQTLTWQITNYQGNSADNSNQSIAVGVSAQNASVVTEKYTWIQNDFGDLSIELGSLNALPMNLLSDGIRLSVKLVEANMCMSCFPRMDASVTYANGQPTGGDINQVLRASDYYYVCDVAIKLRMSKIILDKVSIVKEISWKTQYSYLTYQNRREPISNNNQVQFNFSLNSDNYIGTIICITPWTGVNYGQTLGDSSVVGQSGIDYTVDGFIGSPYQRYEQDHVYIPYNRYYVSIDGTQYSSNQLIIPNRQLASYIESVSESSTMFPSKQYAVQFSEFVTNRHVQFISVNSSAHQGKITRGSQMGFFMEFNQQGQAYQRNLAGNYHVHFYHICTRNLSFDMQKGVIIE